MRTALFLASVAAATLAVVLSMGAFAACAKGSEQRPAVVIPDADAACVVDERITQKHLIRRPDGTWLQLPDCPDARAD